MKQPSEFTVKVIQQIRKIPKGKIATYSQIAKLAGKPHAARGVCWILHSSSETAKLPWHRVLNSKGQISFPRKTASYRQQKSLLEKEGVAFSEGQIDLKKFQWKKQPKAAKKSILRPTIFTS